MGSCVPGGVSPLAPTGAEDAAAAGDAVADDGAVLLGAAVPPELPPPHAARPRASTAPALHAVIRPEFIAVLSLASRDARGVPVLTWPTLAARPETTLLRG
jgi:hypothetical protein